MISKKNILIFILCLASGYSNAQQATKKTTDNNYRIVHWNIYDGLSQGNTYFILKDVHGFLWMGTKYGLNRFDGKVFKNYYHDPHNSRTIAGNDLRTGGLIEDSLHNIWIGTYNGLSRYDIKADTFSNFLPDKNNGPYQAASPFWATKDKLYAREGFYITVYDIHSLKKKVLVKLSGGDEYGWGPSTKYSIFDPVSNSVWMLHGVDNGDGAGLANVSLSDGKKQYFTWPCYLHIPHHNHTSETMCYDPKRKAMWINSPDGLMEFTLADRQFHHIDAMNDVLKLKDYHQSDGIDLDYRGRVWLATAPKGILIYDPSDQSVNIPFPKDSVLQHDVSEANSVIYCDRDGLIWNGSPDRKGFYQLIPFSPAVKLYTPEPKQPLGFGSNLVAGFTKAPNENLWIGTFGGLYQFDKRTGDLEVLNAKAFPGLKNSDVAIPLLIDTNLHKVWMYISGGAYKIDLQTKKRLPIIFKDGLGRILSPDGPKIFFSFGNNWIILAGSNDLQYIFDFDKNSSTATEALRFKFPLNDDLFLSATDHFHLFFIRQDEAKGGNLTFSYQDGKWSRIHHKLDSLQWTSVFFNKKDLTYWVAAESKLFHYDKDFRAIRIYGRADGLPDIEIAGLIADDSGDIWFHTDRNIHRLNIVTGEISTLAEKDGFEKQNFALYDLTYKDDNGDIYFGGGVFGSGFDRIIPSKFTNPPSYLYLQSIEVNQKPFPLGTGVNNLKEISLRYFENRITIETGIIDYYSKGTSRMRYKLEGKGLNENWQYGPANYIIRFEGLQPGGYKLRMQASNAALQFNGPEKVLLITVNPPWWQRWWAWAIYIVLFISAVYAFVAYRSRKLIRDKRVLEHTVQIRTEEVMQQKEEIETQRDGLEKTLVELKATQKQLIQSEKMASLGELTAGIAHEIQNPLNFINNFSEVSRELIVELKEDIDKGDTDEVKLIATDLEQNLEKINHHGKRADAIVKGMLEHSRKSSGHKELTDINALGEEYLRLAYHGMRAKDKTFSVTRETDFDNKAGKINVIGQDIGRVLLNLFNNAFYAVTEKAKIAGAGYQPTVIITTKRKDDKVIITVSDNGNGILQNIKDKIFQPFFTTKPTGQGTGLGLSLSYDIVAAHEGEIKVESMEGEGTKFIISLPV